MRHLIHHLRLVVVAFTALALSAGLALGSTPDAASWGLANAASHAGKTVPVAGGAETLEEDVDADEQEETETPEDTEDEESEAAGENCATDPTALTEEELAELKHGSVVCWAAHQVEWPEWFANRGAWVRCWAQQGKADAPSCMEDPNAEDPTTEDPTDEPALDATASGQGKGKGKGAGATKGDKGKGKPGRD